jgi:hypothetical protein
MSELKWNRVEDGLPTEVGDYFVIREHAELHTIAIAATSFHPRAVPQWYDKGFNYFYWIGPVAKPKELKMVLETGEIRWKIQRPAAAEKKQA